MAKKEQSTDKSASVVMSSEAVILVHAFLQIHAPKLAAKLASKFENLRLEQHADQAEALSNALVNTVKAAMLVPGTDVSKAFSALSEHETEAVKEVESPSKSSGTTVEHSQKQKGKKAKHEKKRKLQEDDETEEQESVLPEKEPESLAPTTPVTEVEVVEHAESRPKKKPTQGERFQRVKSDNVQFLDERLKDMSYDAKSGAGDWGARANADLIVTRGKAFTKEKNKKKRGSYRGGVIDQGSHSIKFTYDDE
ncbi:Similar to S.cerevisiae protein SRP40 (Nucleolar serine-rich protein) [Malassezia sympodialis ATCC 42132]|uniref:Similar to S.cerevisiae protein SRP40 (Nucleolar serine-rich protein) n=1 Tax=Malassezia sympodialis (strain ATCC 42132) TaxID=1230383 RepID=A0A1M8A3T3_MALS4|nr:Similar to S.cerevisiae protein SRP40 (Nucleolar serine-rich protein) [Malassezia sympodialis ATCC 42132]